MSSSSSSTEDQEVASTKCRSALRTISEHSDLQNIKYLVFSGGGQLGCVFIGALDALESVAGADFIQHHVEAFAGCSIGAFVAAACAFGIPVKALEEYFVNFNLNDLREHVSIAGVSQRKGIVPNSYVRDKIMRFFEDVVGVDPMVTFEQLRKTRGKGLKIAVANLSTERLEFFDHRKAPSMPIADALTISMSIPFLVQPTYIDPSWYTDGGLYVNYPVDCFPAKRTLGFRIRSPVPALHENCSATDFFTATVLVNMSFVENSQYQALDPQYHENTVIFVIKRDSGFMDTVFLPAESKHRLIESGRQETVAFLFKRFIATQVWRCCIPPMVAPSSK